MVKIKVRKKKKATLIKSKNKFKKFGEVLKDHWSFKAVKTIQSLDITDVNKNMCHYATNTVKKMNGKSIDWEKTILQSPKCLNSIN